VATPEGFQAQRIIERARELNPGIDTAVRAHTEGELARLDRLGVGIAIMGARELALGLMDYALRSLGVPEDKAHIVVQQMRRSGEGGAFERRPEPVRGAPELRPHQDQ
jgi:CPA2 family monovalent cation:H+ antiporter-2